MVKRIIYSENALQDRAEILAYWYKRIGTKTYSKRLNQTFKEIVKLLSEFPELGRQMENRTERFFVKDYYQIYYTITEETLEILHIWDSRRNPDDLNI
jgi:toxin YoeB